MYNLQALFSIVDYILGPRAKFDPFSQNLRPAKSFSYKNLHLKKKLFFVMKIFI